jgi:hypothetical protein
LTPENAGWNAWSPHSFLTRSYKPNAGQRSVCRDGEAGASRVNHPVAVSISTRLSAKANSVDCGRGSSRCGKPTRRHRRCVEVLRVRRNISGTHIGEHPRRKGNNSNRRICTSMPAHRLALIFP